MSNALVVIALARSVSPEGFGNVSLVIVLMTALLSVARGLFGNRIGVLSADVRALSREVDNAFTLCAFGGAAVALVTMAVCAVSSAPALLWVVAGGIAVALPQDVLRYAAVSRAQPGVALLADGLWAVGSAVAVAITIGRAPAPESVALVWLLSGACSLAVLGVSMRPRLRRNVLGYYAHGNSRGRLALGAEGAVTALNSVVLMALVAGLIGVTAAGALRGAGTIIGPLSVLMSALPLVGLPELARRRTPLNGRAAWSRVWLLGIPIAVGALVLGSLGMWLPADAGRAILGGTWASAKDVLPVMGIEYGFLAWMHTASLGFRYLGAGERLLRIRATYVVGTLGSTAVVATMGGGVVEVAQGLAAMAGVFAVVSVLTLRATPSEDRAML